MRLISGHTVQLLTDVVQANPVCCIHFLLDVPEDDQVAMAQRQLVRRRCEWRPAVWCHQVCVTVSPLETHPCCFWLFPWWHSGYGVWGSNFSLNWQAAEVFRANRIGPGVWGATAHRQEVVPGAAISSWCGWWWRRDSGSSGHRHWRKHGHWRGLRARRGGREGLVAVVQVLRVMMVLMMRMVVVRRGGGRGSGWGEGGWLGTGTRGEDGRCEGGANGGG